MREQRGIAERTLCDYRQYLQPLLAEIGTEPDLLNATRLRRFVLELGRNGGNARAKAATSALRTFTGFWLPKGNALPVLWRPSPVWRTGVCRHCRDICNPMRSSGYSSARIRKPPLANGIAPFAALSGAGSACR